MENFVVSMHLTVIRVSISIRDLPCPYINRNQLLGPVSWDKVEHKYLFTSEEFTDGEKKQAENLQLKFQEIPPGRILL